MSESVERAEAAAVVCNRDIPVLQDVLPVMQLVNRTEELRGWQRGRAEKITANLTGMPRGGDALGDLPKPVRPTEDGVVAALDELDRKQAGECREYACRLRAAQRILNGIESLTMRAFVMMKYVMGLRDGEIRQQLNMTRRGFERARQSVEDAPDMASVKWRERYIVSEDT